MPVCISSGCCLDLGLNVLQSVHFLENYRGQIDGVELVFAYPNELLELEFDDKAFGFLGSLRYNSIHMPFKEVSYENDKETRRLIEKAGIICKDVKCVNAVFHPQCIQNYELIESMGFPASIENLDKKPGYEGFQTSEEIKAILDLHPRLGLCVDTAHAKSNNLDPRDFLLLNKRISSVHINTQWVRKSDNVQKEHGFLVEIMEEDKKQFKQNTPFIKLPVPKIMEADFYPEKVSLIEKEIQLLKQLEMVEVDRKAIRMAAKRVWHTI